MKNISVRHTQLIVINVYLPLSKYLFDKEKWTQEHLWSSERVKKVRKRKQRRKTDLEKETNLIKFVKGQSTGEYKM